MTGNASGTRTARVGRGRGPAEEVGHPPEHLLIGGAGRGQVLRAA